jgi:hypothetical protein
LKLFKTVPSQPRVPVWAIEQRRSRTETRAVDSGTQAGIQVPVFDLRNIDEV